nr:hypothetical protein 11 [Balneolaceae bacterium]
MINIRIYTLLKISLLLLIGILIGNQQLVGQSNRSIDIFVSNKYSQPVSNITVYVTDGYSCLQAKTNNKGIATFNVKSNKVLIYAGDLNSPYKYGVTNYLPNYSSSNYNITIPSYPNNQNEAGRQLDNFMRTLTEAFDLASVADLGQAIAGHRNPLLPSGLGVPGVFSISPIPERDKDGKIVLRIKGALLAPIMQISQLIPGMHYNYKHARL